MIAATALKAIPIFSSLFSSKPPLNEGNIGPRTQECQAFLLPEDRQVCAQQCMPLPSDGYSSCKSVLIRKEVDMNLPLVDPLTGQPWAMIAGIRTAEELPVRLVNGRYTFLEQASPLPQGPEPLVGPSVGAGAFYVGKQFLHLVVDSVTLRTAALESLRQRTGLQLPAAQAVQFLHAYIDFAAQQPVIAALIAAEATPRIGQAVPDYDALQLFQTFLDLSLAKADVRAAIEPEIIRQGGTIRLSASPAQASLFGGVPLWTMAAGAGLLVALLMSD